MWNIKFHFVKPSFAQISFFIHEPISILEKLDIKTTKPTIVISFYLNRIYKLHIKWHYKFIILTL